MLNIIRIPLGQNAAMWQVHALAHLYFFARKSCGVHNHFYLMAGPSAVICQPTVESSFLRQSVQDGHNMRTLQLPFSV